MRLRGLLLLSSTSLVLACGGPVTSNAPRVVRSGPDFITQEEIAAASQDNIYDLIQALHPDWLRKRTDMHGRAPDDIIVYLNDTQIGSIGQLRSISINTAISVLHLTAPAAQLRFGHGHVNGAIVVNTHGF